jgi:hypothetical protein
MELSGVPLCIYPNVKQHIASPVHMFADDMMRSPMSAAHAPPTFISFFGKK